MISQELKLQKANETIETLMKEITSLKEEKVLRISYAFIKGSDMQVVINIIMMFGINMACKCVYKKVLSKTFFLKIDVSREGSRYN